MHYQPRHEFTLTDPAILLSEHYYRRLWLAVRNVEIPRRAWLDELADLIRDYDGVIYTHERLPYELPLVDEVFGDDLDMRWLGYYLLPDQTGAAPRMKSRKIERLQLLDMYFQVKYPAIAKHFMG
jgi:hypothetical protein